MAALILVAALVSACGSGAPASPIVEVTQGPPTTTPAPPTQASAPATPTPIPTRASAPGVMYVPSTGIQASAGAVSRGDEWDILLTVGNKGKGPTDTVSADVRPIPPPSPTVNLNAVFGFIGCTPTCTSGDDGIGGWFVHWDPLQPNTKLTLKIRFRVTTVDTGVSVNVGIIVFEGTSTGISAHSPETEGFDYFGLNCFGLNLQEGVSHPTPRQALRSPDRSGWEVQRATGGRCSHSARRHSDG